MKKLLMLLLLLPAFQAAASAQAVGTSTVVANVPAVPGYPETVLFDPSDSHAFATSPGTPKPTAGLPASRVYEYAPNGSLAATYTLTGENLLADHAVAGLALDAEDRLYVVSTQLGIVRLTPGTTLQETYSPLMPDLPICSASAPPCSPNTTDMPPSLNDLAFDAAGNLYITDLNQATIWKVAPGGGPATIWLQDARFDGLFGPNGIRFDASGANLYVGISLPFTFAGVIYKVPMANPAGMTAFHTFNPGEGPDGFNFAASGNLYVALPAVNAIAVLDPSGNELRRFTGPADRLPYDGPTSVSWRPAHNDFWFTNNATGTGNVLDMALIDVYAGERGLTLVQPSLP